MINIASTNIPIYRGKLVLVFSDNSEEILKFADKHITGFDNDGSAYAHTIFGSYKKKQAFYIILNFGHPHRNITNGTISHEALHVCQFLLKERGVDINDDESVSYLLEWVVDECHSFAEGRYKIELNG